MIFCKDFSIIDFMPQKENQNPYGARFMINSEYRYDYEKNEDRLIRIFKRNCNH